MIGQSKNRVTIFVGLLLCGTAPVLHNICGAPLDVEGTDVLPLSAGAKTSHRETTHNEASTVVRWDGQDYSPDEGMRILIQVVESPATDSGTRADALERLGRLKNKGATPQLLAVYDGLRDRVEKVGVILCLTWSEDPRGLPLFLKIIEHEGDSVVRFFAASALAQWNVRKGVAELITLFDCKEHLNIDRIVGEEAVGIFGSLNRSKKWGFPVDVIRKRLKQRSDLSGEDGIVVWIRETKSWFEANKDRFPDWDIGDPLPDTAPETSGDPAEK